MDKLKTFPVSTVVAGRRVVVAGGGDEALGKLRLLAKTSAAVEVYAADVEAEVAAFAIENDYTVVPRPAVVADFAGAALAFIGTGDEAEDRRLADLAREAKVTVNVVDRPELCDVLTPAIVNRAPLSIAISTEGDGPVLAGIIRSRIEDMLPQGIGRLVSMAGSMRDRVAELLPPGRRRLRFWRDYFSDEQLAVQAVEDEAVARRSALRKLETARSAADGEGHVWLVGAGPGAADLLTVRARRVLSEADVIVYDSLVDEAVLEAGRRDARRIHVGKRKGRHSARQDEINAVLIAEARSGNSVVRLKAGDPMVYGRAGEEIASLREAGVAFSIVPGITAALGAAAEAAIPLTHREHASSLIFATGHAATGEAGIEWAQVARHDATLSLYMAKSVADEVAAQLMAAGLSPDTPVGAVENVGREDGRRFYGRLDELGRLAGMRVDGPVVIFVGRAVAEGEWAEAVAFAEAEALAA
ncbi:siroheme synthase CysG [Lutibaculum baratangense]|uniref:Siroheme synthase n=1 Tax=Lutibaculum baratangense AMV1 TaxID=631454 RepID=V4RBQ4_9HYPH|nr:siroheme synthase CysG [Lutibaculum baratangense]ESR22834.1 Siroheme synthase [Lutibaculum baratangense AMV1]